MGDSTERNFCVGACLKLTHENQGYPAKNHKAAELGCGTFWV